MTPVEIPAGETLMAEGDDAASMFVVVRGRLRAFVGSNDNEAVVGEIGPGEVVGEMALIAAGTRSATVRAVRDTLLLELQRPAFERLVEADPGTLLAITRLLVARLERSIHGSATQAPVRVIAVAPAGTGADLQVFADRLAGALGERLAVTLVGRTRTASELGPGMCDAPVGTPENHSLTAWLDQLEAAHDLAVHVTDPGASPWTDRCLRQADLIVLVARAHTSPVAGEVDNQLADMGYDTTRAKVHLVLLHPAAATSPSGAAAWLESRRVDRVHNIREGSDADFGRLARLLTGEATHIVLSGGGARGIAHVGVLRALEEAGVPVDVVGGASFGSVIGGFAALQWTYEEKIEAVQRAVVDRGSQVDYTVPAVALASGKKILGALRMIFGDSLIEDLWLRFFAVSSNLTKGEVEVHTRGPVWKALRSSIAIPGVYAPVRSDTGDVLIDGGIMNNVPVDVMRSLSDGGPILAVSLRGGLEMPTEDLPADGVISGWGAAWRRLNPFGDRPAVPSIVDVLIRATESGSVAWSHAMEAGADAVLRPPVKGFALMEFDGLRDIAEAGYRYTVERLEEDPGLVKLLSGERTAGTPKR